MTVPLYFGHFAIAHKSSRIGRLRGQQVVQRLHENNGYRYVDTDRTARHAPVILLHGLLGDVEGWKPTVAALAGRAHRVIVPEIPIDSMPLSDANMFGVMEFVRGFISSLAVDKFVLVGNSLGGQIALLYALEKPQNVLGMVLAGSAGIYEVETGTRTFRRQDREWIRQRAEVTFYDPAMATDELVDRLYELSNDTSRALRVLKIARHSLTVNLNEQLHTIRVPTMLIWGKNDQITPEGVALTFKESLPLVELHSIDKCGHAPQMERPDEFNALTLDFLRRTIGEPALSGAPDLS